MKKSGWILFLFVVLGLAAGALVARGLQGVSGLSFLTHAITVSVNPSADLAVLRFDLNFSLNLTLLSIVGAVAAIWLYRKF
jgi:hypothetical protein